MATEAQSGTAKHAVISAPSVLVVFLLLAAASYGALIWAPTENTMGLVQRIFYFHVSSAWSGFVSFLMVFIGSVAYLRTRALKWDWLSVASAEVGVGIFYDCPCDRPHLGKARRRESETDLGCPLDVFFSIVGPVRQLPRIAHPRRGARTARVGFGGIRNFRHPGYSPRVFFDLVVSHAASAACYRRRGIARSPHGLGAAADLDGDARRDDGAHPLALSPGSIALGSRRVSHGGFAKRVRFCSTGALPCAALAIVDEAAQPGRV